MIDQRERERERGVRWRKNGLDFQWLRYDNIVSFEQMINLIRVPLLVPFCILIWIGEIQNRCIVFWKVITDVRCIIYGHLKILLLM